MNIIKHKYFINIYHSPIPAKIALDYVKNHSNILHKHNITLTSANHSWTQLPNVTVITLKTNATNMLAGLKIHNRSKVSILPLEKAVIPHKIKLFTKFDNNHSNRVYEICGLWSLAKNEIRKTNMALTLTACGILLAIPNPSIYIFNSKFTFYITTNMGFQQVLLSPDMDGIPYPNNNFLSYIWSLKYHTGTIYTRTHEAFYLHLNMKYRQHKYVYNDLLFHIE